MTRLSKVFAFLFCLLLAGSVLAKGVYYYGSNTVESSEAETYLGESEIGGGSVSNTDLTYCREVTTVGAFHVLYGWFYGNTNHGDGGTVTMSIWDDDGGDVGSQIGSCSNQGTVPGTGAEAWNQVTWDAPGIALDPTTTYHICFHAVLVGSSTALVKYRNSGSSGDSEYAAAGSCPTQATSSSSYQYTIGVANYDAH